MGPVAAPVAEPPARPQGRKATRGDRLFVDAVIYRARTGFRGAIYRSDSEPVKGVYNRFRNWARKGSPRTRLLYERTA